MPICTTGSRLQWEGLIPIGIVLSFTRPQYGIAQVGGIWFSDDRKQVKLADLGLRVRERFVYQYDFEDNWQHLLRVEAILTPETNRSYPTWIGGKRKAPPFDCGGAWADLALRQK